MGFGDIIDNLIAPFAPATAIRRHAARIGLRHARQYEAATNNRRTKDWKRPASSANREVERSIVGLRNGARDLVRNNKYAAAALNQLKANMVGDGITARCLHSDPEIAAKAQAEWDRWSASKVYDGRHDFFHVQKLVAGSMVEGGEALMLWLPNGNRPDERIRVVEGDFLDHTKTHALANGGRIVQGVEFDAAGNRTAYHLFKDHPGDGWYTGAGLSSLPVDALNVDHIYDEQRPGQARGVSWLGAVALTLRDLDEIEDAVRLKKKVEACLALILSPGEGGQSSMTPDGQSPTAFDENDDENQKLKRIQPGMIWRTFQGETAQVVDPSGSGDTVQFIRHELAAISASLVPYHLMTGDVSQANYSSLRAAMLGFWSLLDGWQQQIIIPLCCQSAFDRRMRSLYLQSGDSKYLQVVAQWAVPNRGFVDPIKDLMGEILAIRAGLLSMTQALSKRGIDIEKQMNEIANVDKLIDKFGLALDTDPRRVTTNGILQAAVGFLAPKGETAKE